MRGITRLIHTETPVNRITDPAFYKWKNLLSICLRFMHQLKCDCHPAIRSLPVFLHTFTKTHSLYRKQFADPGDDLQKHFSTNVSHWKWNLQIKLNFQYQLDFCHHGQYAYCWLAGRIQSWQNTCVQLYLLKRCWMNTMWRISLLFDFPVTCHVENNSCHGPCSWLAWYWIICHIHQQHWLTQTKLAD